MRFKFIFILLILIPFGGIRSQQPIIVSEDSLKIGKSLLPGLSVTIPEANYEKALKAWIKDLQAGTKSDVVTENEEMTIFGAKLKGISPNPLNVYSRIIKLDSMLKLYVALEVKKDEYIEKASRNSEYIKVEDYIREFSKNQYIDVAKDQMDQEGDKLRDLQKELSSLENEKSKMLKSIQSDESTILNEKDNITIQNNELNSAESALREQKNLLRHGSRTSSERKSRAGKGS